MKPHGVRLVRFKRVPTKPASHENAKDPGVVKKVLFTHEELSGGRVQMINWARLPAGRSFRRHCHEDMDEIFIMVEGCAVMKVGGRTVRLVRGDAIAVPFPAVHEMTNSGRKDVEYIVIGITAKGEGKTIVTD